jgi:hypothetical protein
MTQTFTSTRTPTATPTVTSTSSHTPTLTVSGTPTPTPTITATYPPDLLDFYVSKNAFHSGQEAVSIRVATSQFPGGYSLMVYNSAGERVRNLDDRKLTEPFRHSYLWDGSNEYGEKCASGIYLFYLTAPNGVRTARVILIR